MGITVLQDVNDESGNHESVAKELGEAVSLAKQAPAKPAKPSEPVKDAKADEPSPDEKLPPKLRGKSREEIAEMYVHAESTLGRMANDLGTQRHLTDRLLGLKRETDLSKATPPRKITRQELITSDDPTPALDEFVSDRLSRERQATDERLARMERSMAEQTFVARHPDYQTLANDPGFVAWVQATPFRVRAGMAASQGDMAAADELFSEYKATHKDRKVPDETLERDSKADLAAARKAALESGTGGGRQPGDGKSGKVYRRADLIKLRMNDPETYYDEGFQAEIMSAYAQKRVV